MFRYNNVDARLEGRLMELYASHRERSSKIDWSYHEFIPWEQGRSFTALPWHEEQRALPLPIYTAIETALLTEVNLPWFTTHLSITFMGSLGVLRDFIHTWTSEEDQHSNLLETYLIITRNCNPNELHQLRKAVVETGYESEFMVPTQVMGYTAMQELATMVFYNDVAKVARPHDPQLAALLRRLAKDESLHFVFYRDAVMAHLELEPNYIYHVARMMMNFAMPGNGMPDFEKRMQVIGQDGGYGPEQYFTQVFNVLIDYWQVDRLRPLSPEAEEARVKLLKFRDRLQRIVMRRVRGQRLSGGTD